MTDTRERPPVGERLRGVEALRGVAATAVVLSHAARHVDKASGAPALITLFQAGHAGVDLFFAISGFIILFVHGGDIGRPERLGHYLGRRFRRVFPLYWVALGVTLAMLAAGHHALPAPGPLLWFAALLPTFEEPVLGIAWTLQFEMVFYAVFALLISSRRAGIALMAAWLLWVLCAAAGYGAGGVPAALCGSYCLEFLFGMAAAALLRRGRVPAPRGLAGLALAGLALAAFATALVLESAGVLDGYGVAARFAYGIPAALLILGVSAAEQRGALAVPAWLQQLGGASYSIYLFQFVFIGVLWQSLLALGFERRLPQPVLFAALAAAAVLGGVLTARLVEQPLLLAMRGRRRPGPLQA